MYLIGDIGNTEIKICLFDLNFKILKRLVIKTNDITNKHLSRKFIFLNH